MDQLRRCCGRGVLGRCAGLVEDGKDLVLAGVHSCPPSPASLRLVASRQGVGDVVGGRHPLEVWCPCLRRRQSPDGSHHAVDGAVVAVALGQGALAGDVVDVCRPERRQSCREGGDSEDLRQDFQRVDECLPFGEDVEEPVRRLAEVVEDLVANLHDVAPSIATALLPVSAGFVRHMSGLDVTAMVDEEGVCKDGGLRRLGSGIRDESGPDVLEQGRRCHESVDQLRREVGLRPRRLCRPFVDGLDGCPPYRAEDGLGQESQ